MHGAPGAGKTCTQCLLLNEPPPAPPDELTDSTPIACPAVKATRISIDGKNKWERVKQEDLLNQLASRLNEAPNETEHIRILREAPIPTNPVPVPLDDSLPKAELSEKGPPEKKPLEKKPTDMEVIKEIVSALEAGKFKQLSTNWVYFIDSGGQPAYRELLPLFTRAAALNIITIDLTKGLDKEFEFQYRFDQFEHPINQRFSNRDIIQSAVSSGAMFNPIQIPYISESDKDKDIHPRYFVLGTRKDKLEENGTLDDELNEMNKKLLEEYKANKKVIKDPQNQGNIIYPVNTMLKGSEREEASVALCTKISSFEASVTIHIPIRLFAFEISLQREAKQKNRSFLTIEEVKEIGAKPSLEGPPTKIKSTELLETKASSEDPLISILKLSASDRFRDASDRLAGSILSCLVTVSLKLNARRLISQELHKEMITGRDNDVIKAAKLVLAIQTTLDAQANPETYLNDVCSALKELGEKQVTDIVNGLEQPPTKGKVVNPAAAVLVTTGPSPQVLLKTTLGDIDIELWSKEAPLACRNFIQLSAKRPKLEEEKEEESEEEMLEEESKDQTKVYISLFLFGNELKLQAKLLSKENWSGVGSQYCWWAWLSHWGRTHLRKEDPT
uniref:Uncharacterized protein n=1 Tax=Amphimedon queenslandica TaxID=400682 RepID=A0A1X7TDS7_AMPQE